MKLLKILNMINTFSLSWYLIYIILLHDDFFNNKEQVGLPLVGIAVFLTTFICGGITLVMANIKGVNTAMPVSEIKNIPKFWTIICAIEIVLLILFVHNGIVIWYVACLIISYGFVSMEKHIIPIIDQSTIYKITLPLWVFPLPFISFIGGNLYLSDVLPENMFDKVTLIVFILCGLFMIYTVWHSYYIVDEESKTLEKNYGIISEISKKKTNIQFADINSYEKHRMYYLIHTEDIDIKINRLYNNSKRIEKTFEKFGITKRNRLL